MRCNGFGWRETQRVGIRILGTQFFSLPSKPRPRSAKSVWAEARKVLLAADAPQRRLLRPTPRLLAASCASKFVGNFLCVRLAGPLKNLHCVTATIYPNDY